MSNYRRKSKPKSEQIKKGFTVFQKTIATIGSILGLITASITIMNFIDNKNNSKKETTETTIIKEVQRDNSGANNIPAQNQNNHQETTPNEKVQTPESKEDAKTDKKSSTTEVPEISPSQNQPTDTSTTVSNGAS